MAKRRTRNYARTASTKRQTGARKSKYASNRKNRWKNKRFARLYRNPLGKNSQLACLIYNDVISFNPTAGSLSTLSCVNQFCINGMYDPDTTGTGHQPMYFDNYAAVYNRYRVNFAVITATVINHNVNTIKVEGAADVVTTTQQPNHSYKLFIMRDALSQTTNDYPATMNNVIEQGGQDFKWRFVGPSLTGKMPKLKHVASPHQLQRLSFNDDTLRARIGENPAGACYFYVGITSADGVTDPPACYVNIHIKYYVEFSERKPQAQN